MRHAAGMAWAFALALGCGGGVELAGDDEDAAEDGTTADDAADDAVDDGTGGDETPGDAPAETPPGCPPARPEPGSACGAEGARCEYGSETCCGVTHPSYVCQCLGGTFGCYYTDACMGTPFGCACGADEDCERGWGRAWCEGGTCVPCDDSGATCGLHCPGGFVPPRNGCQPCACAPEPCSSVGWGYCTCDALCGEPGVTCAPGLGRCIDDLCADVDCPGPCDPLRGCVERDCSTDADCRLIYSPCGCQAIPPGDPRTSLDPCDYDGGAVCDTNNCLVDGVLARCDGGLCVEAYPPGCGG